LKDKKVKLNDELSQKIYGCLAGVAIGDALGMPSSNLRPEQIKKRYDKVTTFLSAPDDHPIHAGLKEGTITDDTELTMIVINMILEDRKVNRDGMAHRIIQWVQDNNLLATNLLGPSTTRAVQELMAGNDPATRRVVADTRSPPGDQRRYKRRTGPGARCPARETRP